MGLRRRLEKLEQETGGLYDTLYLPDGSQVRYTTEDLLEALSATIDRTEHWLLPILRQAPTDRGLTGLISALESSQQRTEKEKN